MNYYMDYPSAEGLNIGSAAHADDIRSCCVSENDAKDQAKYINNFISNSLALNTDPCLTRL